MKNAIIILCSAVILGGCGPRLIYPHLEWLVPWYVSDYISLDKSQKSMLQSRLVKQLDWHCRTQLPAYAGVLRKIGGDLAGPHPPLDYPQIQAYNTQLLKLWNDLMKQIAPDIVDILATASDEQLDELFANLAKQNREFQKKYIDPPPAKLLENRQKRMLKRVKYWISDLTIEQKALVGEWNTRLTPIAADWLQNRGSVQLEARRLLAQRDEPGFREAMLDFIVDPQSMQTTAYRKKIDANIDTSIGFVIRLNQILKQRQRSYLVKRIESLASDFDRLSCDPKDIPKVPGSRLNGSAVSDPSDGTQ